jgi:hypothetical protein
MRSRYKKFKKAKFFYSNRHVFVAGVLDTKIQRGRIFNELTLSFKTAQKGKEKYQKLTNF